MLTLIRNALTRLILPVAWSRINDHPARTLKKFGDTEADSGWQYLQALEHADDHGLKRMLFSNVMEEYRHADYFFAAAHQLASSRLHSAAVARKRLVNERSDMPYFLAYAHECERSIHGQFDSFAEASRLPAVSEVFRRICADEKDHEVEAFDFLVKHVGSESIARRFVVRAKLSRMYEAWMRGSERIGDAMFGLVLSLVFFSFGPFLVRRATVSSQHRVEGVEDRSALHAR